MIISKNRVDKYNTIQFKVKADTGKKRFICTLCGGKTSMDESYSNQGKNLVCGYCAKTQFNGLHEVLTYTVIGERGKKYES